MSKQQESIDQEIVTVNLTTNRQDPCGQTTDIIIDSDNAHLVKGEALFVNSPGNKGLFIVRTHDGLLPQRTGIESDSFGVSLASYLFGRTHIYRKDKTNPDYSSYERSSFDSNGRPSAISLYRTPESLRATRVLFKKEHDEWLRNNPKAKKKPAEVITLPSANNHASESEKELSAMIEAKQRNKLASTGDEISCPHCSKRFIKEGGSIFCSGYRNPGPNGEQCKNRFNSKMYALRKKIGTSAENQPAPIAKPTSAKKPSVAVSKKATADLNNDTGIVKIRTENGREVDIHADVISTLDTERLKIIFGS